MPGSTEPVTLPPFSAAATYAALEVSVDPLPSGFIKDVLLEIGGYLMSLDMQTKLFGRPANDPYSPSLRTLYTRLCNGYLNPSPIQSHANHRESVEATLGQRTAKGAEHRPLEDFEDLYYAILARMQDVHHTLNARLGSGFSNLTDAVLNDGSNIAKMYHDIAEYWEALNQPEFIQPLDRAIRRSRVRCVHQEIIDELRSERISGAEADRLLHQIYDPEESEMQGLAWVSGWAPSMVAAWLEEKYRIVLQVERQAAEDKRLADEQRAEAVGQAQQPQPELDSMKGDSKAGNEVLMAGGPVRMTRAMEQRAEEQLMRQLERQERVVQDELEWQMKVQRVSEYTQYLRSVASPDVRYIVDRANANYNMRMG